MSNGAPKGLRNLGNTCGLNSLVQCLRASSTVRAMVLAPRPHGGRQSLVTRELLALVNNIETDPQKFIRAAFEALKQRFGDQQDVTEVWLTICDAILEECASAPMPMPESAPDLHVQCKLARARHNPRGESQWSRDIQGMLVHEVACDACSYRCHTFDPFTVIVIQPDCGSIVEGLSRFFGNERLDGWKCDKCGSTSGATRCTRLWSAPKLIVIAIQRTGYNFKNNAPVDVSAGVVFHKGGVIGAPEREFSYKLVSMAMHHGGSHGGHYNAVVRGSGTWWHADDDLVLQTDISRYLKQNSLAYLLLYDIA